MKLELYEIRAKLSDMFANVLPPLIITAKHMKDKDKAEEIIKYCKKIDSLTSSLHRLLPREVEADDKVIHALTGASNEDIDPLSLEDLIKNLDNEISKAGEALILAGVKENKSTWKRDNGAKLHVIDGGKKDEK